MMNTKLLLQDINLEALVEASLHEAGRPSGHWNFWHCPFHSGDHTPSLGVNSEEGNWHCFGCGKGGDAITWVIEFYRMSFKEACEFLSSRASHIPNSTTHRMNFEKPGLLQPDALQELWRAVIDRCQQMLWEPIGSQAREYLHNRGLKRLYLTKPVLPGWILPRHENLWHSC